MIVDYDACETSVSPPPQPPENFPYFSWDEKQMTGVEMDLNLDE